MDQNMKWCQSCGMPMEGENKGIWGTEKDGSESADYCSFCYQDGAFTSDVTMEKMAEISAKGWADNDPSITYEKAKAEIDKMLPQLKRWKK